MLDNIRQQFIRLISAYERERSERIRLEEENGRLSSQCEAYGKQIAELEKKIDSPLKIRLRKLASIISKLGYIASFLVSFSYLFKVIVIDNGYNINNIINII